MKKSEVKRQLINRLPYTFTSFLLKQGVNVYRSFINNTINDMKTEGYFECNDNCIITHIQSITDLKNLLISCAFFWCETPEGHSFWNHIEESWKRYLTDHEK